MLFVDGKPESLVNNDVWVHQESITLCGPNDESEATWKVGYKVGNSSFDIYKWTHFEEKETDKTLAAEGKWVVLTMDLLAVKVCPLVQRVFL